MSTAKDTGELRQTVRTHLEECQNCRGLARVMELPSGPVQIASSQVSLVQRMIIGKLQRVRPLLPPWVFLLAFVFTFIALSCLGVMHLGETGWLALMPMQRITVFTTLAASAALLSFALVRQMVPGQRSVLRSGWLPIGLFVLLCLVVASVFQTRTDPHFLAAGETCLKTGLPYAIPAALVFWLLLRRGAILSPGAVGAVAGMLAGLVSTTVLEGFCQNFDVRHILVWHVGISLLGMVAGWLIATIGEAIRRSLA